MGCIGTNLFRCCPFVPPPRQHKLVCRRMLACLAVRSAQPRRQRQDHWHNEQDKEDQLRVHTAPMVARGCSSTASGHISEMVACGGPAAYTLLYKLSFITATSATYKLLYKHSFITAPLAITTAPSATYKLLYQLSFITAPLAIDKIYSTASIANIKLYFTDNTTRPRAEPHLQVG